MANIVKLNYTADEINEKLGKVDDVVQTVGDSETAVMSQKATTEAVELAAKEFGFYNYFDGRLQTGCYLADGSYTDISNAVTYQNPIRVFHGDKIVTYVNQTVAYITYSYFDSSDNFINRDLSDANVLEYKATVPENATYVYVSLQYPSGVIPTEDYVRGTYLNLGFVEEIQANATEIDGLKTKLAKVSSDLVRYGLYNCFDGEMRDGYYTSDGKFVSSHPYATYKNKIQIASGSKIYTELSSAANYITYAYFNDNDEFILRTLSPSNTTEFEDVAPNNAAYVYVTIQGVEATTSCIKGTWVNDAISDLNNRISDLSEYETSSAIMLTESGDSVQIVDGSGKPAQSVVISSDDANVSLTVCHKNIFNTESLLLASSWTYLNGYYTGTVNGLYNKFGNSNFIPHTDKLGGKRVTVSLEGHSDGQGILAIKIQYTDETSELLKTDNTLVDNVFTITSDATKNVKNIVFTYTSQGSYFIKWMQIEVDSVRTEYEAYNGATYDVDVLNQTGWETIALPTGILNVIPSSGSITEFTYPADLKAYIDRKTAVTYDSNGSAIYTDSECEAAFIEYMNEKAAELGMVDSSFACTVGDDVNVVSAKDMLRALICACGYDKLNEIWNKKSRTVHILGENARSVKINTTVKSNELENSYYIFGGKTGSTSVNNLVVIVNAPDNQKFACCVFDCGDNRFLAAKQACDIAAKVLEDSSYDYSEDECVANYASVALVPSNPRMYDNFDIELLYAKNANDITHPASTTKVLTAICALDFIDNLGELITIHESDITGGSGYECFAGDKLTLKDALYSMMLPSANTVAKAVARTVGYKILSGK